MTQEDSIVYDDESKKLQIERHPIILSETTCFLITTLRSTNHLNHIFTTDYIDHRKEEALATRDLIAQIAPHCSISFLWSLKDAINKEIEYQNASRKSHGGTKVFPLDRPDLGLTKGKTE